MCERRNLQLKSALQIKQRLGSTMHVTFLFWLCHNDKTIIKVTPSIIALLLFINHTVNWLWGTTNTVYNSKNIHELVSKNKPEKNDMPRTNCQTIHGSLFKANIWKPQTVRSMGSYFSLNVFCRNLFCSSNRNTSTVNSYFHLYILKL